MGQLLKFIARLLGSMALTGVYCFLINACCFVLIFTVVFFITRDFSFMYIVQLVIALMIVPFGIKLGITLMGLALAGTIKLINQNKFMSTINTLITIFSIVENFMWIFIYYPKIGNFTSGIYYVGTGILFIFALIASIAFILCLWKRSCAEQIDLFNS